MISENQLKFFFFLNEIQLHLEKKNKVIFLPRSKRENVAMDVSEGRHGDSRAHLLPLSRGPWASVSRFGGGLRQPPAESVVFAVVTLSWPEHNKWGLEDGAWWA